MFSNSARQRSLFVYHLHMGGPDAAAVEWGALRAPRFETRVRHAGVTYVHSASQADVVVVTGVLTSRNLDAVLAELATLPSPSVVIAVGDSVIQGLPVRDAASGGSGQKTPDEEPGEPAIPPQTDAPEQSNSNTQTHVSAHPKPKMLLSHYAEVHISIPGNPPTPQALVAALPAAARLLANPDNRLPPLRD